MNIINKLIYIYGGSIIIEYNEYNELSYVDYYIMWWGFHSTVYIYILNIYIYMYIGYDRHFRARHFRAGILHESDRSGSLSGSIASILQ